MGARRAEDRKELSRKERLREEYGLERKTKLNLPQRPITYSAASFKYMMIHKRNYFAVPGHTWWLAYDSETNRSERSEATAQAAISAIREIAETESLSRTKS